ncbi:MAG: universal stress protein [Flavisolibacter sp.]|nr:universal stress protein [Flavisolibacter sp.]MBD0366629.1 universal stress protein [Flavisolibacter sp.]MBD0374192.1 universal stress protein [Flavisolibacter sp.]
MKKILVIINDYHLPQPVLDCALHIAKREKASLFGLFIKNLKLSDSESYLFPSDINLTDTDFTTETDEQESLHLEDAQLKVFKDACAAEGVPSYTHRIHTNYLDVLLDHSAFADLIICDAEKDPTLYSLKSLLSDAHCPILLVQKEYQAFETIVFTYDGKPSSMEAIRQFTYLFSDKSQLPVHLISAQPTEIDLIEYSDLLKEWLPLHYPNSSIKILKGNAKEEIPQFINHQKNALVVMGAYGRSSLSRFFKESLANVVLEKSAASLFVAHD